MIRIAWDGWGVVEWFRFLDRLRHRLPAFGCGRFQVIRLERLSVSLREFVCGLLPFVRELGKRELNNTFHSRRNERTADFMEPGRRFFDVRREQSVLRVVAERKPAREHLEEDDANRIKIAPAIDAIATDHFRTDVSRRANCINRPVTGKFSKLDMRLGGKTGKPKVHDLE